MLDRAEEKGYIAYLKVLYLSEDEVAESKKNLREYLTQEEHDNDVR